MGMRSSSTMNRLKTNKWIIWTVVVMAVIIIYKYFFSEWSMYPREWVYTHKEDITAAGFTFMTYNILCDGMMRESIYRYENCGSDWLNLEVRQSRMMKEVETVNPDILCVQEIDKKWYDTFWYPGMEARGYEGVPGLTDVENAYTAGQALFWKKAKFTKTIHEQHLFHELLKPFIDKSFQGTEAEEMYQFYTRRNLILLVELQEVTSGSKVIVGCPHFAHHKWKEPSIQVLHAGLSLQYMEKLSQRRGTKSMILAGDLNSPPSHPGYEFINAGQLTTNIREQIKDIISTTKLKPNKNKFDKGVMKYGVEVMNMLPDVFQHNVKLLSAFKVVMGREPFLTCIGDQKGDRNRKLVCDYIWFTPEHLTASGTLKEPDKLMTDIIPYRRGHCHPLFGSDHLPIVAKLYFEQN